MGRKKKQETVPAPGPSQDWEQTLVAGEPAPDAPLPPPEPIELEPLLEPEPAPDDEPVAEEPATLTTQDLEPIEAAAQETLDDEAALDVPEEFRKYVRTDGTALIVKEPFLGAAFRRRLEDHVARRGKLLEKRWVPSHRLPIADLDSAVDKLQWAPRYQPKAVEWLRRGARAKGHALRGLERIPANIIAKRVVYETEGGLVVEVTYRELGQTGHRYFTIPTTGSHAKALDQVKGGSYAQTVSVSHDLVDLLVKDGGKGGKKGKPGRITTWPIRNDAPAFNLHGISRKRASALARLGIETTDQLRVYSPKILARHLGANPRAAEKMQHEAELLLIKGLGPKYAHLLVEAGIAGLDGLKLQKPDGIVEAVNGVLVKIRSRRKPPRMGRAKALDWIRKARAMKKTSQPFPV